MAKRTIMKLVQVLILALACLPATQAAAQTAASGRPCQEEFLSLQEERTKLGAGLKAAQARKVERAEFCNMIKSYSAVEGKGVQVLETNQIWCCIPAPA